MSRATLITQCAALTRQIVETERRIFYDKLSLSFQTTITEALADIVLDWFEGCPPDDFTLTDNEFQSFVTNLIQIVLSKVTDEGFRHTVRMRQYKEHQRNDKMKVHETEDGTQTMVDSDDYFTPCSVWKNIQHVLPMDKILWECFYGNGRSGEYLQELGFTVINEPVNFFDHDFGDVLVSNP